MRIRCLFSTFLLVLLSAGSALAFGRILYPDRPLNLRASRSARAQWVGALYPGQKVRIGFERDGWAAVFEPDETRADERFAVGFSNVKYLKTRRTRFEPKPWGEFVKVTRNLNIRDKAGVKGRKLDQLKAGRVVKIDFPDGDWTRVFDAGATIRSEMNGMGYASVKYLEPAENPALARRPEPVRVSPVVEAGDGKGRVVAKASPPPSIAVAAPAKPDRSESEVRPSAPVSLTVGTSAATSPVVGPSAQAEAGKPASAEVASSASPAPRPKAAEAETPASGAAEKASGGRRTIVIDRSRFTGAKRPDPTPDRSAHGFQYRLLEKSETRSYGVAWITLKIFLATKVLPNEPELKDFASTMWKENRRPGKNLAVLLYLPGMDTDDLSYAVIRFDDTRLLEFWVRRTTLFGTKFL